MNSVGTPVSTQIGRDRAETEDRFLFYRLGHPSVGANAITLGVGTRNWRRIEAAGSKISRRTILPFSVR